MKQHSALLRSSLIVQIEVFKTNHCYHDVHFNRTQANLNIHFHMLFLDGVYEVDSGGKTAKFHAIETPTPGEMQRLLHRISERIARLLERQGYLERDSEDGSLLLLDGLEDNVLNELQGSSITYRIAVGRSRGKKVFTLKTLPSMDDEDDINGQALVKAGGFSLHAGVSAKSQQTLSGSSENHYMY